MGVEMSVFGREMHHEHGELEQEKSKERTFEGEERVFGMGDGDWNLGIGKNEYENYKNFFFRQESMKWNILSQLVMGGAFICKNAQLFLAHFDTFFMPKLFAVFVIF